MRAGPRADQLRRLLWRHGPLILRLHTLATVLVTFGLFVVLFKGTAPGELEPMAFQVIADPKSSYTIDDVDPVLAKAQSVLGMPTRRATTPFWLRLPLDGNETDEVVLLGDKQLTSVEIWSVDRDGHAHHLGAYSRDVEPSAPFDRSSNVVAVTLPRVGDDARVLIARVTSRASSTLTMTKGRIAQYLDYKVVHERAAATLAGGLGLLAVFSALVAYFAAMPLFITFAVWLVSSIAVSGAFFEYDYLWFGVWAGQTTELRVKLLVVTLYSLTTTYMFMHLFRRGLARCGMLRAFRWLVLVNAGLAFASLVIPASAYLPLFWCFVAVAFGTSVVAMVRIVRMSDRSGTPGWYAAGWGVQVAAGLAEVFYAAGLIPRIPGISFQSGILISCLITGLAAADTLRVERLRRKRAQKAAFLSAKEYRRIYDTAVVGMVTVDADGSIVLANRLMRETFSEFTPQGDAKRLPLATLVGPSNAEALMSAAQRGAKVSVQYERGSADVKRVYAVDAVASSAGVELTFNDITASTRLTETLKHLSEHDSLTGLANRRGLESVYKRVQEGVEAGGRACVAYLDLDRFKVINEFFGHATGDAILNEVARRMRAASTPPLPIGRIGGDEFILVLPGIDRVTAQAVMNGVLDRLASSPYEVDGKALSISACAGVIELAPGMTSADAIAFSDRACALAKTRGKGVVASIDQTDSILTEYKAKNALGTEIRARFPVERLRLYSQPIVPLDPAEPRPCFEVLLRVTDDAGKIGPPGKLIQIAEQQGLMAEVDRFVLRNTLEHLSSNLPHARRLKFAAVNLSGMSLNDERFLADAIAMLREHESVARHVMVEITESVALSDIDSTRRFVDQMREFGARVALDDFGAGYTSFTYLKSFPANLVKIDGGFIRDLNRHPANYAITRAITALCHELKIQCVAEWVEDVNTLVGLLEVDMDYAQGYVFSEAKPLEHWLDHRVDAEPLRQALSTFGKQAPFRRRAEPIDRQLRARGA
jgi:diguanylate cyclase (GGDEF)-like protein